MAVDLVIYLHRYGGLLRVLAADRVATAPGEVWAVTAPGRREAEAILGRYLRLRAKPPADGPEGDDDAASLRDTTRRVREVKA